MWGDRRHFDRLRRDEAVADGFKTIGAAETGTEIALLEVVASEILLSRDGCGGESLTAGNIGVVKEEGRGKVQVASLRWWHTPIMTQSQHLLCELTAYNVMDRDHDRLQNAPALSQYVLNSADRSTSKEFGAKAHSPSLGGESHWLDQP